MDRFVLATSRLSCSSDVNTAWACFSIPRIARVVFSNNPPIITDTINEIISIEIKDIPICNIKSNKITILEVIVTTRIPPSFSITWEEDYETQRP